MDTSLPSSSRSTLSGDWWCLWPIPCFARCVVVSRLFCNCHYFVRHRDDGHGGGLNCVSLGYSRGLPTGGKVA